ncbi:LuxR family transcriptional regulator [Polaribacter reichenbachii]|uniref:Helix-turn-helix transcriptional regulator n=1 Tax=Polaribacter reichenbachii TaxID=996801 RepID=A0A1B8TUX0_9FLAO|nr:response regulator transcription factor [Polaribacter reichenbachii]APZ45685.1 LuxR family transcriptional regulator [Polaribacter reichenbachii]AUC19547.1 LuxR family transcriptional regulator [Polaribacter reichenbachii]OBY63299.1 helix-turn-helix transcriptional regulator [Polaribacter reichenbachii]
MKKTVLVFSLLILAILLLFQFSKYALISNDLQLEIIIGLIAIVFFFIGIFIHKKSLQKPVVSSSVINQKKIKELEISNREYEVLQKIAEGLSNKEIANDLFVSESTIKTHVSNILLKLNAKRRTQAIQIAKAYKII